MFVQRHFPESLAARIATMVRLHADNRYDRVTGDVETITGRPATTVRDFVASHADRFQRSA